MLLPALLAGVVVVFSACGSDDRSTSNQDATLLLDFQPNAVHAGVFLAQSRLYPQAAGVDLTVRAPGQSTDPTRLLLSGRVQFAILDIHDLAIARQKGRDLVGVMAIVQKPLASVIAQPGIRDPKALEGHRVGVTGLPSDVAVLDSIVRGAGGDPAKVKQTTIGFDAVPAILGRKVSGVTAFWNAEGVALKAKRQVNIFRVEDYGAPAYPELVLTVTRKTLEDDPSLVGNTVKALERGYEAAVQDPPSAIEALTSQNQGLPVGLTRTELAAVKGAFEDSAGHAGTLDAAALGRWAAWEKKFGVVADAPDVEKMFDRRFAGG